MRDSAFYALEVADVEGWTTCVWLGGTSMINIASHNFFSSIVKLIDSNLARLSVPCCPSSRVASCGIAASHHSSHKLEPRGDASKTAEK